MILLNGGDDEDNAPRWFGLFVIVLGPLFVRIWCEFVIVIFRINETLSELGRN